MKAARTKQNLSSNASVVHQGPAARYLQNVELQGEVEKAERTVAQQERQIEALQSQVDDISVGAGRLTNLKVGGMFRHLVFSQVRAVSHCFDPSWV